jgi:hypothetical protein
MHSSRRDGPCGENTGRGYLPDGSSVGRSEAVPQAPNSAILYSTLQVTSGPPSPAANSASASGSDDCSKAIGTTPYGPGHE